jgi:hypothetical protein
MVGPVEPLFVVLLVGSFLPLQETINIGIIATNKVVTKNLIAFIHL